jgi:ribosomal-protein-alanine N-acetyltransferase
MIVCETARLRLRHLLDADAPFIVELLNEPDFIRNIGDRQVRTLEDARNYIQHGPMVSYSQHGFGLFLVELRENGAPIGICGLLKREYLDDIDVGFALRESYPGQRLCARGRLGGHAPRTGAPGYPPDRCHHLTR